eukprot:1762010-Pleurochrysis_carterae.AAC.3
MRQRLSAQEESQQFSMQTRPTIRCPAVIFFLATTLHALLRTRRSALFNSVHRHVYCATRHAATSWAWHTTVMSEGLQANKRNT